MLEELFFPLISNKAYFPPLKYSRGWIFSIVYWYELINIAVSYKPKANFFFPINILKH